MILNEKETDSFGAERNLHYICGANGLAAILTNDCKVLLTGEDMYGNEADVADYVVSFIDIATIGIAKKVIPVGKYVYRCVNSLNTGGSVYSSGKIIYNEMKKILFEILIFVLIDIIIIFVVVNFKWGGNSPLNESELKRFIPILIAVTIVIGISSHFFNSNNQE